MSELKLVRMIVFPKQPKVVNHKIGSRSRVVYAWDHKQKPGQGTSDGFFDEKKIRKR